jgi:hypothetical protein
MLRCSEKRGHAARAGTLTTSGLDLSDASSDGMRVPDQGAVSDLVILIRRGQSRPPPHLGRPPAHPFRVRRAYHFCGLCADGPIVGIEPRKRHTPFFGMGGFSASVIRNGCSFPSARNARENLRRRDIFHVARFAGLYGSAYRDLPPRGRPRVIGRGFNESLWDDRHSGLRTGDRSSPCPNREPFRFG